MTKHNVDLRQDELVLHMIRIADGLLKSSPESLDLCLVTYAVMPFTSRDGLLSLITDSMSLSEIQKSFPKDSIR